MLNSKQKCSLLFGLACAWLPFGTIEAAPLSGAIFTTTVDGNVVNGNVIYEAKEDVYLDGGPGPNAPSRAAGLPAGDYYFQVTDPSGKDLLSSDHISCRRVGVNEFGVIEQVFAGTTLKKSKGKWQSSPCQHEIGIDIDYAELGAITVQLYPYDDTPNPGGVYKVWMTPVEAYTGVIPDCDGASGSCNVNGENWQPGNVHGFVPALSKMDNYKVKKRGKPFDTPDINVFKFHDANLNGMQDLGEEDVAGWSVTLTEPSSLQTNLFTPVLSYLAAEIGIYLVQEETPAGTLQTAAILDGLSLNPVSNTVQVDVEGFSGETHSVIFGNAGLGSVIACKIFDQNGNGIVDEGEPGIPGWKMQLEGLDVLGNIVEQEGITGSDGCKTFSNLIPGDYTVTEILPAAGTWVVTGDLTQDATITSSLVGSDIQGSLVEAAFTNICTVTVDFDTKGYWHNKNGLAEITDTDIAYINLLALYAAPSSYFNAGDEPFDGLYSDGSPVASAYNNEDVALMALEGTARAEISHFLVDTNAGADPREQLAQQLLAFILNTQHRLDSPSSAIQLPSGEYVAASDLILLAIQTWSLGSAEDQIEVKNILDAFNNNDQVNVVPAQPCEVHY